MLLEDRLAQREHRLRLALHLRAPLPDPERIRAAAPRDDDVRVRRHHDQEHRHAPRDAQHLHAELQRDDDERLSGRRRLDGDQPCCPGGSFPCADGQKGSLDLFIQEYTGALPAPEGAGTAANSCIWPASTSAACTFVDDSFGDFNSLHHDNTNYLSLGSIAAGASRYFRIAVAEPSDAGNGLQGQMATFAIYWHME